MWDKAIETLGKLEAEHPEENWEQGESEDEVTTSRSLGFLLFY